MPFELSVPPAISFAPRERPPGASGRSVLICTTPIFGYLESHSGFSLSIPYHTSKAGRLSRIVLCILHDAIRCYRATISCVSRQILSTNCSLHNIRTYFDTYYIICGLASTRQAMKDFRLTEADMSIIINFNMLFSAVLELIRLLRASAKREASFYWYTLKIWVWAAGRPARRPWWRFWEAYISGTVSPIDKRSSLVGNPIPSAVYGTTAESCQCLLWHVARATWGDVTNVPPAVSR